MGQESMNDVWTDVQIEMRKVEALTRALPSGSGDKHATYGGPFDFCNQEADLINKLWADLRWARAQFMRLSGRIEAYNRIQAAPEGPSDTDRGGEDATH